MNGKDNSDWTIVGNCIACRAPLYRWDLPDNNCTNEMPRWTCGCTLDSKRGGAYRASESRRGVATPPRTRRDETNER
jgi:hypothetical protein